MPFLRLTAASDNLDRVRRDKAKAAEEEQAKEARGAAQPPFLVFQVYILI